MKMKPITRTIRVIAVFMLLFVTSLAVQFDYIGSISDGLSAPTALDVGDGYLAALEPYTKQLIVYSPDGTISQKIDIEGTISGLERISESTYIFCDRNRRQVMAINLSDSSLQPFLPNYINLLDPIDIELNGSVVYILDAGNSRIVAFDQQSQIHSSFSLIDSTGQPIGFASSFTWDSDHGHFYILDQINSTVWVVDLAGDFLSSFASFGTDQGQLTRGGTILYGHDGNVYISDRYQSRVVLFSSNGEFLAVLDQAAGDEKMVLPTGMALDGSGVLYIASTEGASIHVYSVQPAGLPQQYYTTSQIHPEPYDTVGTEQVTLAARVEFTTEAGIAPTGIDFELYTLHGDSSIATAANIHPSQASSLNDGLIIAEWVIGTTLDADATYEWRTRFHGIDTVGEWTARQRFHTRSQLPTNFRLGQNYPNPFNPRTTISFDLPYQSLVRIDVINLLGQKMITLVNETLQAGQNEVVWDGRDQSGQWAASGVYFYRLTAGQFTQTKKMVLLK